jgi:ABC-type Mn2+/Zn2+ transport system permease subunit
VCSGVMMIIYRLYSKLVLINISEDLALSEGVSVKKYNFIYLILIAIVVALGVKMVGGLLTAALVAIPPAAARNLAKNLQQYAVGAMLIGVISASSGIVLHFLFGYPAGPIIVVASTCCFLLTLPFARR